MVGKGEKEGRVRKGEWRTMRGRTGEGKGKGEGKGRGKGKVKRKGEARREGELILPTIKSWIRHCSGIVSKRMHMSNSVV